MTDGTATDLDDLTGWIDVLKAATAEKSRIDDVIAQARAKIEDALGDDEVGLVAGTPVVKWTHVTSTRFDQKRAKALLSPDELATCMVATESRRFTLVEDPS